MERLKQIPDGVCTHDKCTYMSLFQLLSQTAQGIANLCTNGQLSKLLTAGLSWQGKGHGNGF